jgi:hypothetical protein
MLSHAKRAGSVLSLLVRCHYVSDCLVLPVLFFSLPLLPSSLPVGVLVFCVYFSTHSLNISRDFKKASASDTQHAEYEMIWAIVDFRIGEMSFKPRPAWVSRFRRINT